MRRLFSDKVLLGVLMVVLVLHYGRLIQSSVSEDALIVVSCIATIPVLASAWQSIRNKKVSVDLLAGVALMVSLLNQEWASAAFINLMLTSARIFGRTVMELQLIANAFLNSSLALPSASIKRLAR